LIGWSSVTTTSASSLPVVCVVGGWMMLPPFEQAEAPLRVGRATSEVQLSSALAFSTTAWSTLIGSQAL
jgi:hypothetical protein